MSKGKIYKYHPCTNLKIGTDVQFLRGHFSTDDKKLQEIVESHPFFGNLITEVETAKETPADVVKKVIHFEDLPEDGKCPFCDYVAKSKHSLVLHIKNMHPEVTYIPKSKAKK